MPPVLALYEDVFANGAALTLPAGARMIFLVHGSATIAGIVTCARIRQRGCEWVRSGKKPGAAH